MKNLCLILSICVLAFSPVYAEDIDLLSDEMLLGGDTQALQSEDSQSTAEEDESQDENSGSIFGFIIEPISNFFKSEEKVTEVSEGEKESPLDKSIRQAKEGSIEDQMSLGYMYLYGTNGVEADTKKAFQYYEMAAEQNDPIAVNNLGSLYFSGIGTKKNVDMALSLFSKAADLGNDNAALNLAFILLTGGVKDPARNQRAFELFEKAQKSGNKIAEFMLGYAYYKGFVVQPNYQEAYKLIKDAANGKSQIDEAQLQLANLYAEGIGTVQDYAAAEKSYLAAVKQGNMEAILTLADIYSEGKFKITKINMAHALYNIAAANGVQEAAAKRDELSKSMPQEMLANAQATARNYKPAPSELTGYIRQTYGNNIRNYIDNNIPEAGKK